jgi:glycoprotein endo-alpha-1,2-mannosidase
MKMKKIALIIFLVLVLCLTAAGAALAMSSDSYNLLWSVLSSGGGQRDSTNYNLNDNIGDVSAGGAQSDNYKLGSVFQYSTPGSPFIPGDANEDDVVNIFDMVKVARIILELDDPTPGADANEDGSIDVFDMTKIARIILELDSFYSVGVYYYPWYFDDFHGGNYLREHLVPMQEPVLGEYNDRNSDVIDQHLEWSHYAGINFWATSWWGPGSREDITLLNHILQHPELDNLKIAIMYETTGRTSDFTDYSNLGPDITYLANHYFNHPNYLKINGKPVIFIYLTRVLSERGVLENSLNVMRTAAAVSGYSLFIVGDHAFGNPPSLPGDIGLLDAVTNYDVYGCMGATGYATQTSVNAYYTTQSKWRSLAHSGGAAFIPSVSPGFNDRGVRHGHAPLSRKLAPEQEFGSLFRAMVQQAKNQVDAGIGRIIMVTSWNEWHEDTQIEPVSIAEATNLDDSATGSAYTDGLYYEGYGMRYLGILQQEMEP